MPRLGLFLVILSIVAACNQDEQPSAFVVNNSVLPGDFLTDKTYTILNIEVVYVAGYQPTVDALDNLRTFLTQRLNKTGGINISQRSISSPGRTSVDLDVIRELEKTNRQQTTSGKTITAYIFFIDAEYSQSTATSKVLGVTYGASAIAVFGPTIKSFTGGIGRPSAASLESVILGHEFGHVLGLVNNGISMVASHHDDTHSGHCSDTKCLMYYQAQTNTIAGNLVSNGIPTLDVNCLADLKAAGGK